MGQAALQLRQQRQRRNTDLRVVQGGAAIARTTPTSSDVLPRDIILLGITMVLLQLLDGVFTAIGVAHFGTAMEGNYLLRGLMNLVGYLPALLVVKSATIALTGVLCVQAAKLTWVRSAFIGVIGIYLLAAIIPWSYILWQEFLT